MQKFYRVDSVSGAPSLGPFYGKDSAGQVAAWGFRLNADDTESTASSLRRMLFVSMAGVSFPGVFKPEKPARGALVAPAAADITNHSTLTMNDGFSGPVVFEFIKSGSVTPGNQEIDITGATTPAQVAAAIAAAIATWVGSLSIIPQGDGRGFLAFQTAEVLKIVQAFPAKNTRGVQQLYAFTWIGKTSGAFGNSAIVPSVPGEWTGRIRGMTGGKARNAGCYARPISGPARSQCLTSFVPALTVPLG